MTIIAIATFVVVFVLIATEKVPRIPAVIGGAAVLLGTGVLDSHDAFFSEATGVDWNVIFLLFGMMIIVGVLRRTGLFEYLGIKALKIARADPWRLMILLVLITALGSALLDNVTTVLLVAPITIAICERLGIRPIPFLLAEVFASNIGGAATLIGDPPNIIIASRADLSFNDFLIHMAPVATIAMGVFLVMLRFLFRGAFVSDSSLVEAALSMDAGQAITNPRLLRRSLVVLTAVLIGFVLHTVTHVELSVVALVGAAVLMLLSGLNIEECMEDVEWETLAFFMGLFLVVGSLVKTGVINNLAETATEFASGNLLPTAMGLLVVSAVLSGLVDNIPYAAAMSPLVGQVVNDAGPGSNASALWWVLALGADFGGNATAVGASANVVLLGIARRHGHPVSFWEFTRKGVVVTAVTIAVAALYVWLRYFN